MKRPAPFLLLAIVALGGFLRIYRIDGQGLWLDEAFSVWMARQPMADMLDWLVRIDQHPPLYYALLHFWMGLGDGEAAVRALSALCGILTIPALYLLGRRLVGQEVGLLAALILAVSPFHVRFAQEARMYTLLTLNASLALYALARLLTEPTGLAWLGYVIFTTATLLSHNTAVLFPVATNLVVLSMYLVSASGFRPVELETRFCRHWLLAQAGVFLLWSPWLPAFLAQSAGVYREFWLRAPTWETVANVLASFVSAFLPWPSLGVWIVGPLFAGLAVLGLVHLRRHPTCVPFLLITFATPFVGEWLVSLRRPIFYDRTLIWASLPLYLLLAAGVSQLRQRRYIIAVVLMILTVNGLSLREYYAHFEKEGWDEAAALVAQQAEADDLILFNATWAQIPFDHYFHRLDDRPLAEHGLPVDLFDRGVLEPKMADSDLPRLRALIRGRDRVWLVYSHAWYTDPQRLIPPALAAELDLLERWDFTGLQVRLYGNR